MHKLIRPEQPPELDNCDHSTLKWGDFAKQDVVRDAIWNQLITMQHHRCAYCEANITEHACRHIEHFRSRKNHPPGTFDWNNLFGSCNCKDSCGTHKDRDGADPYDWEKLIKPDIDDPDDYFVFVRDGTIVPRRSLQQDPEKLRRATETLRVFNLHAERGPLRQLREEAISIYWSEYLAKAEFALKFPGTVDLGAVVQELLLETATLPFATAIRHALTVAHS